ncbi:hypothetical protein QO000_000001, partial [Alkalihalobacillus hemicentroti]|nr:hypothetical protein [Alkalihalobacillus hemicentroti]
LAGQVRPHRSVSDEEAHRPPRGKRASWSGNQPLPKKIQGLNVTISIVDF